MKEVRQFKGDSLRRQARDRAANFLSSGFIGITRMSLGLVDQKPSPDIYDADIYGSNGSRPVVIVHSEQSRGSRVMHVPENGADTYIIKAVEEN